MRTKTHARSGALAVLAALALAPTPVTAQFPGDVLFDPPSLVVRPTTDFEVTLSTFIGSDRLGALTTNLAFSDTDVEFLSLEPQSSQYGNGIKATPTDSGLRITVVKSADAPGQIGTIPLATLKFRTRAGARTKFSIRSQVEESRDIDLQSYPSRTGFAVDISVGLGSSAARSTAKANSPRSPGTPLSNTPAHSMLAHSWQSAGFLNPVGPLGSAVDAFVMDWWTRTWRRVRVYTFDARAPRDYTGTR